jgi:hypothetical protein
MPTRVGWSDGGLGSRVQSLGVGGWGLGVWSESNQKRAQERNQGLRFKVREWGRGFVQVPMFEVVSLRFRV